VGGAPVFPRDVARFRDAFPGACVVTVYGSTEAEPIARLTHSEVTSDDLRAMRQGRGLLAGRPVDTMQVRILPDQWGRAISPLRSSQLEAQCLPAGAAGEIVVHGPQVLTSYLHGEENAETKFFVGDATWHRTGDAGMFDVRGRLWLLGRCAARISDACGVLYPLAVEAAVSFHPGVRRAAVVSRDARRVLVVEPAQDACRDNLARLREELAWAHIDVLALESHIPLDQRHHAKIDYPALWRLLEAPQSHL
jgi:acyl-CoA synthetase (AMP-forming)/AMP-acid ligase II